MAKKVAKKPPTKTEIYNNVAEETGLTKKQVDAVFTSLEKQIGKSISKRGPGSFTIPGLCKIYRHRKKALPKRQVRNPQTGEMMWADPKPAQDVVKVRPLKRLKDMI